MKTRLLFSFLLVSLFSFGQFSDTVSLNNFIRNTVRDKRPDKVTAEQLQQALIGVSQFAGGNILNQYTIKQKAAAWFDSLKVSKQFVDTVKIGGKLYVIGDNNFFSGKLLLGDSSLLNADLNKFYVNGQTKFLGNVFQSGGRVLLNGATDDGATALQIKGNISLFNPNGANNVAVGLHAMDSITTGQNNTAFGLGALQLTSSANSNTAFGYYALNANKTGFRNIAVGAWALQRSVTAGTGGSGFGNTSIGVFSTEYLKVGEGNVSVGQDAGGGIDTSFYNTYIGSEAGYNSNLITKHTYVTALGFRAQRGNLTAISNSTIIGHDLNTSLSNVVILGRTDQHILIGNPAIDNGKALQVVGGISLTDVLSLPALTPPTSSADTMGNDGDLMRDASGNIYLKNGGTWLKFTGVSF